MGFFDSVPAPVRSWLRLVPIERRAKFIQLAAIKGSDGENQLFALDRDGKVWQSGSWSVGDHKEDGWVEYPADRYELNSDE